MGDHGKTSTGQNKGRLTIVLGLTSAYVAAEVIGGLVTGSLALLADAGHMLTDVAGLAMALMAIRFGERPATPQRTYGYFRVEILAALANAVILIGISIYILVEAYGRFRNPPEIPGGTVLLIAMFGLAINGVGLWLLRGGSSESLNVKGAYFEVLSDALSSIGVIIAAVVMQTTGWYYADPIIGAGIGIFVFPRTWRLLKEAVGVLLEGTPADVNLAALRAAILEVPGVGEVHDLHVWSLTSHMNALSGHVVLTDGVAFDEVRATVAQRIAKDFKVHHLTLQIEAQSCGDTSLHV